MTKILVLLKVSIKLTPQILSTALHQAPTTQIVTPLLFSYK